jgi:hypothetical protein
MACCTHDDKDYHGHGCTRLESGAPEIAKDCLKHFGVYTFTCALSLQKHLMHFAHKNSIHFILHKIHVSKDKCMVTFC